MQGEEGMSAKKPEVGPMQADSVESGAKMVIEWWPIDRPRPYKRNARKWSGVAIQKVAASIKEFGWQQPIVCDGDDEIIIGHLRQAAGRYLGHTTVPVHVARDLTPDQVKALRIADNRLHEEASWDTMLLGGDLIELKVAQFDLAVTGFETDEIIESVFGAGGTKKKASRKAEQGSDESGRLETKFQVLVECADEAQQIAVLELLNEHGFNCRALL